MLDDRTPVAGSEDFGRDARSALAQVTHLFTDCVGSVKCRAVIGPRGAPATSGFPGAPTVRTAAPKARQLNRAAAMLAATAARACPLTSSEITLDIHFLPGVFTRPLFIS